MGTYQLGVDLGTTYTGAAVRRDGTSEIVSLGTRSATMPTVVVAAPDGTMVVGEAAERRALELPERTARQFKRRLGDTTPILLGGSPYSPQALLGAVLADVVARVTAEQGGAPARVALTHPANWGPYKRELVRQVAELAGLAAADVATLTEPAAAALHYASQAHLEPGSSVAVYDLGGGTFDAAVVRIDATGAELLGEPTGIEHLGGIDFDAAVFEHVARELGPRLDPLVDGSAASGALLWRLREECTRAKEALSTDADAVVGVALPDGFVDVRITRGEFEELVRPALVPTAAALRRAVESAGIAVDDLAGVLLVGGSSRIPLVSEVVARELGRPVLLDTHPKHAVALGAAAHAAGAEVGEVVAVVGGEGAAPAPEPLRRSWRAPAAAAVVVLLAAVGLLLGLVLAGGDDPDQVAVEDADVERSTTTSRRDDAGATTTTATTGTTLVLAPGDTAPEGAVTTVLANGDVVVLDPGPRGGAGQVGTTAPPITAATTAPTTVPATVAFSLPSTVRNAVVSGGDVVSRYPQDGNPGAGTPETVRVLVAWQPPSDLGGGLSHYRVVGTPLFAGTSQFGSVLQADVAPSQTSREFLVTIGARDQGLGNNGFVRWEITAVNQAGSSGVVRPEYVVPNLTGGSIYDPYRVIWSLGGVVNNNPNGSCTFEAVCSQSPQSGTRGNGQGISIVSDESP